MTVLVVTQRWKIMGGYVLTGKGIEKLETKRQELERTKEQIALETCLNRTTVSKAFQGDKPLNKSSIRQLFLGLGLSLEDSDYQPVTKQVQFTKVTVSMNDRENVNQAAASLEKFADKAEQEGDQEEADRLRKEAADLKRIAAQETQGN